MLSKPCHRGPVHDGIIRTITTTRLCWTTTGVHNQRENLRQVVSGKDGDSHHFVDNKSPDSHHGGTSVVEFDRSLLDLGLFVELVPSEVEGTVAVVTDEFGFVVEPFGVTVDNGGDGEEGKHLEEDVLSVLGGQEVVEGLESGRDISGTGESNSGGGDEVSGDGKHGNTSVGDFVLPEKVEFLLGTVLDESERIEESELW